MKPNVNSTAGKPKTSNPKKKNFENLASILMACILRLTLRITGSKKKSEERAALFVDRVHAFVSPFSLFITRYY